MFCEDYKLFRRGVVLIREGKRVTQEFSDPCERLSNCEEARNFFDEASS